MRFRITVPSMLIVSVVVAGLAVILVESVQNHLVSQVDRGLVNEAHYVRAQLAGHHILPSTTPSGEYGQFFLADGTLVGATNNLRGARPLVHVVAAGPSPRLTTISTRRFGRLRVLEEQLGTGSAPILVEGQRINQITNATRSLTVDVAVGAPLLVLAVGLLIWLVVGRAMKTVESVRVAVAEISEEDLDERVSNPRTGDELERLVLTMNVMLERLQGAIERERRFVADASHEVRSPIAAVRAVLESEESNPVDMRATRRSALRALQRLQDLAEQLLILDSAGRPVIGVSPRLVDVDELVLILADELRRTTALDIDTSAVSGGQVLSNEIDVLRVIENLASNAVRHAESTVAFSVTETDGVVELTVSDDGPGIPEETRNVIFERFRRLDGDRGRTTGGSGLGLSIVWEISTRHGGSVRAEDAEGGGARFVVALPASTPAGTGDPDRAHQHREGTRSHRQATPVRQHHG